MFPCFYLWNNIFLSNIFSRNCHSVPIAIGIRFMQKLAKRDEISDFVFVGLKLAKESLSVFNHAL